MTASTPPVREPRRRGALGQHGHRDARLLELPGGQPRALQQRARLARQHLDRLAGGGLGVDDAERGAPARRSPASRCCRASAARRASGARRGRARRSAGRPRGPRRGSPAPRPRRRRAASTRSTAQARLTAVGRAARIIAAPSSRRPARAASTTPNAPQIPIAGAPRTASRADRVDHLLGRRQPQHPLLAGQQRLVDDLDRVARPGHRRAHAENLRQELRDELLVAGHVHQERVVAPRRLDLVVADVGAERLSSRTMCASARCRSASRC